MGLTIHLVKAGKDGDVLRYAAPFNTSSDAYLGVARTSEELVDVVGSMGLDEEEEADIIARGTAILEGEDPPVPEIIDMAGFSVLYERLYTAVGFIGSPAQPAISLQMAPPTIEEIRLLVTGIRFLREFYDEGDRGIGLTGLGFVTL